MFLRYCCLTDLVPPTKNEEVKAEAEEVVEMQEGVAKKRYC
jgi:hypothetical protein